MKRGGWIAGALASAWLAASSATAQEIVPQDRAIDFQPAASELMAQAQDFHNFLLVIITAVTLLVLFLLVWVIVRYNRRANPTPRAFTHNMTVEVIWTIVPVLILVLIAWKSFPLLFQAERVPPAELTLKVTGNSWYWTYAYPDLNVEIVSNMLPEEEARDPANPRPYLLATDNPLYVPIDTTVELLITSNDVIHSFALPSFLVKEDAIQGRVNEGWFRADSSLIEPGTTVYGQCSELCGVNHAYMPIEIRVVTREEFDAWVASQGGTVASAAPAPDAPAVLPPANTEPDAARAETPTR